MTRRGPRSSSLALASFLGVALAGVGPAAAQDAPKAKGDELVDRGDYLFKAGYYYRASENYRLALIEDPGSTQKKLSFGHSLFAVGNYSYASYALRRGVAELDPSLGFKVDVASLFPSRRAFSQALRDLKRYVTYSPRDPAGLTVLGYVLYTVEGEERRCHDMFRYLKRLDPEDAFAEFFLRQLRQRGADEATTSPPSPGPRRAVFLNGFPRALADRVAKALEADPEVKAVLPGGGTPQRVVLELSYAGADVRVTLKRVLERLSVRFHFREGSLPHHVEVHYEGAADDGPARVQPPRPLEVEPPAPAPKAPAEAKPPVVDKAPVEVAPKPAPRPRVDLKRLIPEPKRQREHLENEWPAPAPAPAR